MNFNARFSTHDHRCCINSFLPQHPRLFLAEQQLPPDLSPSKSRLIDLPSKEWRPCREDGQKTSQHSVACLFQGDEWFRTKKRREKWKHKIENRGFEVLLKKKKGEKRRPQETHDNWNLTPVKNIQDKVFSEGLRFHNQLILKDISNHRTPQAVGLSVDPSGRG